MKLPSKEILLSDLDKNPKLLALFEANWNLINSLSSEDFIAWSEQADPIQLQNFHLYGEYKKRESRQPSILQKILNHEVTQSLLEFLGRVGSAALVALFFSVMGALVLAVFIFFVWVGIRIYLYNKIFALGYAVFMVLFVSALPQAFGS